MNKPQIVAFIVDEAGKTKNFNDLNYEQRCKLDKIIKDNIMFHKNICSLEIKSD